MAASHPRTGSSAPGNPVSVRSRTLKTFAVAVGVVGTGVLLTYFVGLAAIRSNRRIATERTILQHLESFVSCMKDAETGARGYILMGDETYLGPHREALAEIRSEQETLRGWASARELPSTAVEGVIATGNEKLAELDRTIQLRRESGLEAAIEAARDGREKALMDKIRADIDEMSAALEASVRRGVRRANALTWVRVATFILTGLLSMAILGWAYRRLSSETEKREATAREVLREKELLQTTLTSIGDGVIITDSRSQVTFLNGEAERLTGWTRAEATGRPLSMVFRIVNERTRHPAENPVDRVLQRGAVVGLANHTILIARDGKEIPIDDSAAPIRNPNGSLFGVVLVFRDVRGQREAEANRARLAAIVRSSGDAIISKNLEGTIQTWNEGAERLFGHSAEEIIGKPMTLLIPPEHRDQELEILDRIRQGIPLERLETVRVARDGRHLPVSVSVSPVKDAEGRVVGASTIIRDISESVAARQALARGREELEREVEERTRRLRDVVREMEAFTYTVAHDLRAPLRAITGYGEMLMEEHSADLSRGSGIDYLRKISEGARKMDDLIRDLLEYSHLARTDLNLESVSLDRVVSEALSQLESHLASRKARVTVDSPLPRLQAHAPTLLRVVVNLISNAVKFVPPDKQPQVRIRAEARRNRIRLWIEDNGIGIEPEYTERIFRVFERLNRPEDYPGTGIGLAIVRRAMERMGGRCGVESVPAQGSRFWIELPRGTP